MDNLYTLEQIKLAFWGTFFESGEWWFGSKNDFSEGGGETEDGWREFLEELEKVVTDNE